MAIYKIRKRNGVIVSFEKGKIETAIQKAFESAGEKDSSVVAKLADKVVKEVEKKIGANIPDIEAVQDAVEFVLMKEGYETVAKNFITYRAKRAGVRKDREILLDVGDTMNEYLDHLDRRINENANIAYSIGGLILKNSEKITANYRLSHVYPEEIGNAHRNGDLHIHDLGMFTPYCAGRSLRQLLEEGFNGVGGKVESNPPKHLQSAVNQMVNFFGVLQNERVGAQAFSSLDTYLAPFVHKYSEELDAELQETGATFASPAARQAFIDKKVYKYVLQNLQNFVFNLNTPSRWGTQTPFTNITLDWTCPEDLKEKALYLGGLGSGPYKKKFGELEKEMKIVNRALINVYIQGDMHGRIFTFPIPTYNITEDFPRDDPDVGELFEMTAKYGIPYFQNFIGSQYMLNEKGENIANPSAYKPGNVRSMCCRLQLDLKALEKRGGGLFGSAEMTGSVGVVTLNMPRIGYNFKGDKEGFKEQVRYLMTLGKNSLEIKRKVVNRRLDAGLYPYTKRYLATFRNHFSTIGLNGMNESILNFTNGKEDVSTKWGREFAAEILDFMRDILTEFQEETGNLYNLEATPAEGVSYRLAREDKKQLPGIIHAGTNDAPYYTNSSQLPVTFTDDVFEALDIQDELQCKYTGGTVFHVYLGERVTDAEACKALVKKCMSKYRMPYISITPTFSICPKHGYIAGEHDYCPTCDKEIGYTGAEYDLETRDIFTADKSKLEKFRESQISI